MSTTLPSAIVDALRDVVTVVEDLSTRPTLEALAADVRVLTDAVANVLALLPPPKALVDELDPADAAEARAQVDALERAKFGGG